MNIEDFKSDVDLDLNKLSMHKRLDKIVNIISLGLFSNKKNVDKYLNKYEKSKMYYEEYRQLLQKAIELDSELESIIIDGVRVCKHTFYDLPIIGKNDYGIDWDILRKQILLRDNYECQEYDGFCVGPLQIHHINALSKGGTNSENNLVTLCFYHHSQKHEHMRNKINGNIRS